MVSYIHVIALFWHPFPDAASIPSVTGSLVVDGVPGVAGFHAVRDMLATVNPAVTNVAVIFVISAIPECTSGYKIATILCFKNSIWVSKTQYLVLISVHKFLWVIVFAFIQRIQTQHTILCF
jgi:hypothetical protein